MTGDRTESTGTGGSKADAFSGADDVPPRTEHTDERPADAVVSDAIAAADRAMGTIRDYDQAAADDLARAVTLAVHREDHADRIAHRTLKDTGMGNLADKRTKLRDRMRVILDDALDEPTVGRIPTDRPGVIEFAKPVGVVGALIPSTNPGPTIANVALLALKGRNAVVFSAAPVSMNTARLTVDYIREELRRIGVPADLVQLLPEPATRDRANELLDCADLVQVTGSARNVRAGQTSGTPNYCVGEGNLVAIVDETADLEAAAERIAIGVTFEYGTACVGESNLVVHQTVYPDLLDRLEAENGYLCSATERDRLARTLFPDSAESLRRDVVGRSAQEIAAEAGVQVPDTAEFLLVEGTGIGPDHPLSGETLSPVLTTYITPDFTTALNTTEELLQYEGVGHSCTVHTRVDDRARRAGRELPVCRLGINQSGHGPSGTVENGLDATYSLGGGPWAGNQLDENLRAEQFITSTRVAMPIEPSEPDADRLFGPISDVGGDPDDGDDSGPFDRLVSWFRSE